MDVEEVKRRVQEIKKVSFDDESAHSEEDKLHHEVLAAIAAGATNSAELASAALETRVLEFSRWYA